MGYTPFYGRVDEVALEVLGLEIDGRGGMDDVVEAVLFGGEDIVEGVGGGDVGDVDKGDVGRPARVQSKDFLRFAFGAYAGNDAVVALLDVSLDARKSG